MRKLGENILKSISYIGFSFFIMFLVAQAGSLTPPGSPAPTMKSLQDIWDVLAGNNDASSITPDLSGNIQQQLKWIAQNFDGNYQYGSNNPNEVLTTAGGSYLAKNLTPENVKAGVVFGPNNGSLVGTFTGGGGWVYGSNDPTKVLTTADSPGTYDASNLTPSVVKKGVSFGVGIIGDYPSLNNPLEGADQNIPDLTSDNTSITSSNGLVEWWGADGTRYQANLDFPDLQNVCSLDTVNNIAGTLVIDASKVLKGESYCGISGSFDPWSPQKNVRWDDDKYGSSTTGNPFDEFTGEESVWIQTDDGADSPKCVADNSKQICLNSNEVWKDMRTGLYWTDRTSGTVDNEFRYDATGQCNFTDAGNSNQLCDNQDPTDSYSEDDDVSANDFCLNLELDSDNDGTLETDWRLPTQKEFLQAYIDGAGNNLINTNKWFWSSTERSGKAKDAFIVYLSDGRAKYVKKSANYYVRCVR